MTDNNKQFDHDEYQFPADEYVAADVNNKVADAHEDFEHDEPQKAASPLERLLHAAPFLRNKRVVGAIIIALVGLVGFKVMGPSHETKVVQAPVAKPQPQVIVREQDNPQMTSQMGDMQQSLQSDQQTINQLQNQIGNLSAALDKANQTQARTDSAISALVNQISLLNDKVEQLQSLKPNASHNLTFTIKAIEPGRAWLEGSNGLTESVTVGDVVPGYGRVVSVDANTATVATSGGRSIHYGPNDY